MSSIAHCFVSGMTWCGLIAFVLSGCGGNDAQSLSSREPTPDPKNLVVQLSDLPARFSLVPGETHPTPLAAVLADPWSPSVADVIRRERVAGYQTTFRSPEAGTLQCTAAVYLSAAGAREVSQHQTRRFTAFVVDRGGRVQRVDRIGEETHAYSYPWMSADGLTVTWRYGSVLSSCISISPGGDLALLTRIALAQQARISALMG